MTYFHNTYLMVRHGQSEANASGVIVSDPKNRLPAFWPDQAEARSGTGIPSGLHRSLARHETAEIRPLAQRSQPTRISSVVSG